MITKKKFLQALRSGQYDQAHGKLRTTPGRYGDAGFCCIGLYCELVAPDQWRAKDSTFSSYAGGTNALDSHYALRDFGKTLGMHEDTPLEVLFKIQTHMIHMNDGIGDFEGTPHSFDEIADWLEDDLEAFVEELYGEMRYTRA